MQGQNKLVTKSIGSGKLCGGIDMELFLYSQVGARLGESEKIWYEVFV